MTERFPHPSRVTVSDDAYMVTGLLPQCPECVLADGHDGEHLPDHDDWPIHQPDAPDAPIPGRHWYAGCEPGGDLDPETGRYSGTGPRVDPSTGVCEGCGARACRVCGRENCPDHPQKERSMTSILEEARARGLARATVADFAPELRAEMEAATDGHPDLAAALAEHLGHFAAPGNCPGCGHGWFTWRFVHGAGYCSTCKWPGRLYHIIKDTRPEALCLDCGKPRGTHAELQYCASGDPFDTFAAPNALRLETLLWAHPDEVDER